MRKAQVLYKDLKAGILQQEEDGSFLFRYHDEWLSDNTKANISLTLPKNQVEFKSPYLFPFFYSLLQEGKNKEVICRKARIEREDYFSLLLLCTKSDAIGAVRIIKLEAP